MPTTLPPTNQRLDAPWSRLGVRLSDSSGTMFCKRAIAGADVLGMSGIDDFIIGREVVTITGGTGIESDPWTINRGQRGTTPYEHLKGALVIGANRQILVHSRSILDYTARWGGPHGVSISTSAPGGPERATWTVEDTYPYTSLPDPRSPVEIFYNGRCIWIGLIDEDDPQFRVGSASVTIVARGYSLRGTDLPYTFSKFFPEFTPVYMIMDRARLDLMSDIAAGNYEGGGRSIVNRTGDMIGKKWQDVANEVCAFGDLDDKPVYWFIRNILGSTTYPQLDVYNRTQAERFHYTVPLEWLTPASIQWVTSVVTNQVSVLYARGVTSVSSNEGLVEMRGTVRGRYIPAGNQIDGIGLAQQIGRSVTNTYGTIQPAASGIEIKYPFYVRDRLGAIVPLWEVQCPGLLIVTGIDPGNDRLPMGIGFFMKGTNWNEDGRSLNISTEAALSVVDDISHYIRETSKAPDSPTKMNVQGDGSGGGSTPVQEASKDDNMFGGGGTTGITGPGVGKDTNPAADDGRFSFPALPPGADMPTPVFQLGSGLADSAGVGVRCELQTHTSFRFMAVRLKVDTSTAVITIKLWMITNVSGTEFVQPIGTISSTGSSVFSSNFVLDVSLAGEELANITFPAQTWFRAEVETTDGATKLALLTIHGQKLTDVAPLTGLTAADPVGVPTVTAGPDAGTMTLHVEFRAPVQLKIRFGTIDEQSMASSWPMTQGLKKIHDVKMTGFEAGKHYKFEVFALQTGFPMTSVGTCDGMA